MPLVNFLPWRKQRLRRRARNWLMLLLLQLVLITLSLGGFQRGWHQQRLTLQHELSEMSARQRQLTAQYQQTRQVWNIWRDYQAQRDADAAGLRHNQRYLNLLEQMATMIPHRLWLTDIADRGEHLVITGLSESYGDIADLNRSLGRHPALGRVRILQAQRYQQQRPLLRFSLQADWEPAGWPRDGIIGD